MKACPGSKFDEIETAFRANEFNYYLFALVDHTLVLPYV